MQRTLLLPRWCFTTLRPLRPLRSHLPVAVEILSILLFVCRCDDAEHANAKFGELTYILFEQSFCLLARIEEIVLTERYTAFAQHAMT